MLCCEHDDRGTFHRKPNERKIEMFPVSFLLESGVICPIQCKWLSLMHLSMLQPRVEREGGGEGGGGVRGGAADKKSQKSIHGMGWDGNGNGMQIIHINLKINLVHRFN